MLDGDNEELEFLGDPVLNMVITRERFRQFGRLETVRPEAPYRSKRTGSGAGVPLCGESRAVDEPIYQFEEWDADQWNCDCTCGGVTGFGKGPSKIKAKKKAAYMVLVRLMKSAGICEKAWEEEMYRGF